jgi:uncharacterized protein (DUF2252 family)
VYALNDFDESLVGDYQMDLWRLAVSILLAMKQVGVGDSDKVGPHAQNFSFHYCYHFQATGDRTVKSTFSWY